MADAPSDFWEEADEEEPPLTTSGGSSGGTNANPKKKETDLEKIAPLFFTNSHGEVDPYVKELQNKGIVTMSAIFALGTYSADLLFSAFKEHGYIPVLALLQTLADYIKQNMPELVDTQSKRTRLEWDDIDANGFDKVLFKIHITAAYEKYIRALEKAFSPDESMDPNQEYDYDLAPTKHPNRVSPHATEKTKDRGTFSPKVTWNGKVQTFETFKSTVESWLIQHDMDYLIEHFFVIEYIRSGSFTTAKQATTIPPEITPNQFRTDSKMLYISTGSVASTYVNVSTRNF